MPLLPLTENSPPRALVSARITDDTERVTFAQRTTPTGERAFGHFSMPVQTVVAALKGQATDEAMLGWLRDFASPEPDRDESHSPLPAASVEAALVVEELLGEGCARAFCLGCNRNLTPRAVRLVRTARGHDAVNYRYMCSDDHLLLAVTTAQVVAVAESRAA